MNKRNGEALTEYSSEPEAVDGANYVNQKYDNNLTPYQCDSCNLWHLSPKNRQTPSKKCYSCKDGNGRLKALYQTKTDAKRRSEILYKERGVHLTVYSCPSSNGWHLTKNSY